MLSQSLLLACLAVGMGASGALAVAGARARPSAPVGLAGVVGLMLALVFAVGGAAMFGV
ncbi:hypothetical protein [Methylorubrum populi]|uniref:Uncharacterized protein n=1 Tax=Methylorubrum populi TaxID=223967 RepID=A0A833J6Y8_9HYPH|nr:hypothetical protein [Methylorubrum populi]KAB7785364.1 hypothetical protein F8B43_1865 [Methylorubrum populi]